MSDKGWRLVPGVRREERARFLLFVSLLGGISLAQTVGLAGAEALLLGRRGAAILPFAFILGALVTVAGSLVYAGLVGAARNDLLFVHLLATGALLLLGGAVAASVEARGSALALFALWFVGQAVLLSHFWTFASDHFDTLAAKRVFPLFGVGASLGGAVGGALAAGLALSAPPEWLIVAWALGLAAVAVGLRAARAKLLRWGPLAFDEADETSFVALRAALRGLRVSPIARALTASALLMMMALFLSQYLYSEIFARRYPDASDLAAVFGLLLFVTNGVEVAVEVAVTPWLIRRFGLANANLVHPTTSLAVFGGLAAEPGLAAAIAARVNRETLENALAQPVRNLVYNALPPRMRGRMRALLEGIVVYTGMAIAGGVLLAFPELDLRLACAVGAGLALLYLAANLGVRRAYLQALVRQLKEGRLDLADLGEGLGMAEISRLADLWRAILADEALRGPALLELAPLLAARGAHAPLHEAMHHEDARVRAAAAGALALVSDEPSKRAALAALEDPEPEVRRAVATALASAGAVDAPTARALHERLEDPEPLVRAAAASALGEAGIEALAELARSTRQEEAVAALARLPDALVALACARAEDDDPTVRRVALDAVTRLRATADLDPSELEKSLRHPDLRVRAAAVRAIGVRPGAADCLALGEALADPAREVRLAAAEALGRAGETGMSVTLAHLDDERSESVAAALEAVSHWEGEASRRALVGAFRRHVLELWEHLLAAHALGSGGERLLREAHLDAIARHNALAFRALALAEGEALVESIRRALQLGPPAARTEALEVLSNLGDREAAGLLALASESGDLEDRIRSDARFAERPRTPDEVLAAAPKSRDRWVRQAARALVRGAGPEEREAMEKLIGLRQVPLFGRLSLDQLEAISRVMSDAAYTVGEVIVREGEPGSDLFLLLEGEVEIWQNYETPAAVLRNRLAAVAYFGEMAVLDDSPRSATVVVAREARVSVLEGARLKELVLQMPDIAFDLFGELSRRLRSAERALAERHEQEAARAAS